MTRYSRGINGYGATVRRSQLPPLEVVITKAEGLGGGSRGRRYMDMLSAYSAVNQGHRHPRIIKALRTGR